MTIIRTSIEDAVSFRYLKYAIDVATERALPDSRDGLKPVHRRILFSMNDLGLDYNKGYKKCARVVGDVLGKYHPHGDASVYDAMVILAQDFSTRYPLVDGEGNFGSTDGDGAAAMRYTLSRLSKFGQTMLNDIKKNTVPFKPNYDCQDMEPTVLPTLLPNLLINGSHGIAVGLATKIPPHNICDVYRACYYMIDKALAKEDPDANELATLVGAPDFPTGGTIIGLSGIREGYKTGRGSFYIRSKYEISTKEKNEFIVIKEIPYKVNKLKMINKIRASMNDEKNNKGDVTKRALFPQIKEIRDESDREGTRIVIEVKKGESTTILINNLIKSDVGFQKSFSMNLISLSEGAPKLMTLEDMLNDFLAHSAYVVTNRTNFELEKASKRFVIVEGLKRLHEETYEDGTSLLEAVLDIVRNSDNPSEDMTSLNFNAEQIKYILDMKIRSLTKVSVDKLNDEHESLVAECNRCEAILGSEEGLLKEIKENFQELEQTFSDERRSEIQISADSIEEEDLITDETLVVTYTNEGIIKAVEEKEYKSQKRGGKGVKATNTKDDEIIKFMFTTSSKDDLLFFTDLGRCHHLKAYKIGKSSKAAKGRSINNYLNLEIGEKIVSVLNTCIKNKENDLFFLTKKGIVKRLSLEQLSTRLTVTKVISFKEDDSLLSVLLLKDGEHVLIATKKGQTLRINPDHEGKSVRPMGRAAAGVTGIKISDNDEAVSMCAIKDDDTILTLTELGLGKITKASDWNIIGRGAKGVVGHKITSKSGDLVEIVNINKDQDEIFIASEEGLIVRVESIESIRECSRSSTGVKIMNLSSGDKITSISINKKDFEEGDDAINV